MITLKRPWPVIVSWVISSGALAQDPGTFCAYLPNVLATSQQNIQAELDALCTGNLPSQLFQAAWDHPLNSTEQRFETLTMEEILDGDEPNNDRALYVHAVNEELDDGNR